jgi:hypothetical protein
MSMADQSSFRTGPCYYLKTLQSSQIEAIELITNPSAKYDAAGNAGIINIRLKRINHWNKWFCECGMEYRPMLNTMQALH